MNKFTLTLFSKFKLLAFIITIILVIFYDHLPKKKLQLHPKPTTFLESTADSVAGGSSTFSWINEKKHHWVCEYRDGVLYTFCSLSLIFSNRPLQPVDLSGYSHLEIDLDYKGTANYLRIFVRNKYDHETKVSQLEGGKFNAVLRKPQFFDMSTHIYFDEFRVADWWIAEFNVPPSEITPDVSKAISIGIDLPHPAPLGKHEYKLYSLNAVGVYIQKESLYFGIILFWTILLLGEIAFKFIHLRNNSAKYSKMLSNMTEQSAQYKEKAETDKLTRVLNREGLSQIVSSLEDKGLLQQYSLMVLDLDHFKIINDEHGHMVGDSVLQDVAKVITSCMRSYDILARWGGEEFVVLFHCMNDQTMVTFSEKVRNAIQSATYCNGQQGFVTASLGVSKLGNPPDFDLAFQKADKAVYKAKELGRNRCIIYDE
jgi:diguanylate cyclase (GGDEF)-like protein